MGKKQRITYRNNHGLKVKRPAIVTDIECVCEKVGVKEEVGFSEASYLPHLAIILNRHDCSDVCDVASKKGL